MKNIFLSILIALISFGALAESNDVYGSVSDIFYRNGQGEEAVYFRLNVSSGTAASCMTQGTAIDWWVNLASPVAKHQIKLIEKSRDENKEIRIMGLDNKCSSGEISNIDTPYEISPNWAPGT